MFNYIPELVLIRIGFTEGTYSCALQALRFFSTANNQQEPTPTFELNVIRDGINTIQPSTPRPTPDVTPRPSKPNVIQISDSAEENNVALTSHV